MFREWADEPIASDYGEHAKTWHIIVIRKI
jgi:hypothetical protein